MKLLAILAPLAIAVQLEAAPKLQAVDCGQGETIRVTVSCRVGAVITTYRLALPGVPGATNQGGLFAQPGSSAGRRR
jgi:hypothetical protein